MKAVFATLICLFATTAIAAPSSSDVNQIAFEVLLKNAGSMVTDAGQSAASVISQVIVTGQKTSNKVQNSCKYDRNDRLFNCALIITNADDGSAKLESSTTIRYQLERDANGLPTNPFFMSISVEQAG